MSYLLDVNVLIALIDKDHIAHEVAHSWFASTGRNDWATCATTENGLLRIIGNPNYQSSPGSPARVLPALRELRSLPGHSFWAEDASLTDQSLVDGEKLLSASRVTDTYLLALAAAKGGQLATFDRRLVPDAVRGGAAALCLIAGH